MRNPFTFGIQPGTGRIFLDDVGAKTWEEIDEGAAGANYGWPTTEGPFTLEQFPTFTPPIYWYGHDGSDAAIMAGDGLARAIRPVLKWLRPVEGALAADSLIQAPRRTSASVAALMLSLALVVAFAGMARASYGSIVDWMNTTLNPDLFIMPSRRIITRTIRFPATIGTEVAAVPGVERVQMVRETRVVFRKTPVMVVAVEMTSIAQTARRPPVEGNADEMYRRTAAGDGLMVSDNLAQLQHLKLGEMLDVPAPGGLIHLPIVGVIVDYSDQQGTILMDRSVFVRYWHDDSVNVLRVYLKPGARMPDVRQRIL
jgi:putative ABC transport system permease protein